MHILLSILLLCFTISACSRAPFDTSQPAVQIYDEELALSDDLGWKSLHFTLRNLIESWKRKQNDTVTSVLQFGERNVSVPQYIKALETLLADLERDRSGRQFIASLQANFEIFAVYGDPELADVDIGLDYDPVVVGVSRKTEKYSQGIYRSPKDLITVRLENYGATFPTVNWIPRVMSRMDESQKKLTGRLTDKNEHLVPRVVPYFTRKELEQDRKLDKQRLAIAYVDPVSAYLLHIRGSGVIRLGEKELLVERSAGNGRLRKQLTIGSSDHDKNSAPSLKAIEQYLRSLDSEALERLILEDESYSFFEVLTDGFRTEFGSDRIGGRTIATDRTLFPIGTLAYLEYKRSDPDAIASETEWYKRSRFVVDSDISAAATGAAKTQLYVGSSTTYDNLSRSFNSKGRLFYFVPRPEFIETEN